MATFEIDIDDGLARTLDAVVPPGVDAEGWLSLQAEAAIAQERIDQRTQQVEQQASAAVGPQPGAALPDDALMTNDTPDDADDDADATSD